MTDEVWTIQKILTWTTQHLEKKGDEHPRLSAEWLLSAVTGLSRVQLYTNFDKPLGGCQGDGGCGHFLRMSALACARQLSAVQKGSRSST